jgi:hypothetical protein
VIDDDVGARGLRRTGRTGQVRELVGQLTVPELGRSTTAPRVLREANRGLRFGRHRRSVPATAPASYRGRDFL